MALLSLLNTQVQEGRSDSPLLDVVDVWYTIQGEGPFAGRPAVFVRLAGCNLQCPHCDTDYTTGRKEVSALELMDRVSVTWRECPGYASLPFGHFRPLVVITGGEPFRQRIADFVRLLLMADYLVQIETNGTLHPVEDFLFYSWSLKLVCSPKAGVHQDLVRHIDCFKYVLAAGQIASDGLPTVTLGSSAPVFRPPPTLVTRDRIYVQPEDSSDESVAKANLQATVASAMTHGYTLSIQTHKILGLK